MLAPKKLWMQRVGYGSADLGCNLIWQMITIYQLYFYTDVVELPVATAGLILLITRLVDALGGLIMGLLIDRTTSRWGKSRPYLLWGALPFAVFAYLAFYTPHGDPHIRTVYALITSILLSLFYTMVNLPLTSILPNMEADHRERTNLVTSRVFFSFVGSSIVSGLTLYLVQYFGMGNLREGFAGTMSLYAALAGLTVFLSFILVREKMQTSENLIDWKRSFKSLIVNRQWIIFAFNIIFMWGAFFIQQASFIYFLKYSVKANTDLTTLIITLSTVVPLLGTLATPLLSKFLNKRDLFLISSTIHIAGIAMLAIPPNGQQTLICAIVVSSIGFGIRHTIYFSMQADTVIYGQKLTGIDSSGTIASLNQFIGKLTMAASGLIVGFLMADGGYQQGVKHSAQVVAAINMSYVYLPIILVIISMIIISRYHTDEVKL